MTPDAAGVCLCVSVCACALCCCICRRMQTAGIRLHVVLLTAAFLGVMDSLRGSHVGGRRASLQLQHHTHTAVFRCSALHFTTSDFLFLSHTSSSAPCLCLDVSSGAKSVDASAEAEKWFNEPALCSHNTDSLTVQTNSPTDGSHRQPSPPEGQV